MPCRIYKVGFQEKYLNLNRRSRSVEIRGSNPDPGSNFSLENIILKLTCIYFLCFKIPKCL